MATKKVSTKKSGKRRRKGIVEDPPVVVGGGNSVDITFNANASTPPVQPPGRKKFRQASNITNIVIDDGMGKDYVIPVKSDSFKAVFI